MIGTGSGPHGPRWTLGCGPVALRTWSAGSSSSRPGASAGGVDPPAHARGVAICWRERLQRAGRLEAAALLGGALRDNELRWLEARCPGPDTGADGAFAALLQVEERCLEAAVLEAGSVDGSLVDGNSVGGGSAAVAADEVRGVRGRLREVLAAQAAAGGLAPNLRTRMAGRMVDHADDAILWTGEASAAACARGLEEALDALDWHLDSVEVGAGPDRIRLQRRRNRVERELVEQRLQARLEARFGVHRVALWERGVVACILGVLLLLGLEVLGMMGLVSLSGWVLTAADTAICGFLLLDFTVKLAFVSRRRLWLSRHLWTDLIPSIPFGLFAGLDGMLGEAGQASRLVRLFRLARVGAYLRALRPLVWLARALGFLLRDWIAWCAVTPGRSRWRSSCSPRRGSSESRGGGRRSDEAPWRPWGGQWTPGTWTPTRRPMSRSEMRWSAPGAPC